VSGKLVPEFLSCFEGCGRGGRRWVKFDFEGEKSVKRTRLLTGKNPNQVA